jgi:hypothetical protein
MRFVGSLILALLLMTTGGCSQKVNDPADVHAIRKSLDDYAKAMNAGDTDGVAALMTDKTVYAHLNVPVAVGRDAIRSMAMCWVILGAFGVIMRPIGRMEVRCSESPGGQGLSLLQASSPW